MSEYWMRRILIAAGVYNILWGSIVSLCPNELFLLADMQAPAYPALFQCIGMMIAVFGVAYLGASVDPLRQWPVIAAGLLGRILGPVGFLFGVLDGVFTWKAGLTILTNDLIWWIPFTLMLVTSLRFSMARYQ